MKLQTIKTAVCIVLQWEADSARESKRNNNNNTNEKKAFQQQKTENRLSKRYDGVQIKQKEDE